ncbi:MAG: hypothetical protein MMC33_005823 [Icmadophila ericetorum]|nr:hypothetical protein [Icmadophila ericetorum]
MSSPGLGAEIFGRIAYEFSLLQPWLTTHLHLLASALFPIFTGAHASLSRPTSAEKPQSATKKDGGEAEDEDEQVESVRRMEGLSPLDAILYPIAAGSLLTGLYFLMKWLQDPEILNKILNWYLSVFGVFSIAKLLIDSFDIVTSFALPAKYSYRGVLWEVKPQLRLAIPKVNGRVYEKSAINSPSPLPGPLSQVPLPKFISEALWSVRDIVTQPFCVLEAYLRGEGEARVPVRIQDVSSLLFATLAVLYYNLIAKPWWLTNLFGISFSYGALQLMSPTTFWTGTLVLGALFIYDIYFVFFTPIMISVATNLDIPVKLLFPRPLGIDDDPAKPKLSMLGLGDVVLPGIMIGLALRFDLYLHYLKMQKHTEVTKDSEETPASTKLVKAPYQNATGNWGERFWVGANIPDVKRGYAFPKPYFYASVVGYNIGMTCTLGVMHVYQHGQPALLYLVPGVLVSIWVTAYFKGDIKDMWEYNEAEDDQKKSDKAKATSSDAKAPKSAFWPYTKLITTEEGNSKITSEDTTAKKKPLDRRIISLAITLPDTPTPKRSDKTAKPPTKDKPEPAPERPVKLNTSPEHSQSNSPSPTGSESLVLIDKKESIEPEGKLKEKTNLLETYLKAAEAEPSFKEPEGKRRRVD